VSEATQQGLELGLVRLGVTGSPLFAGMSFWRVARSPPTARSAPRPVVPPPAAHPELARLLCLVDSLRVGDVRVRSVAARELHGALTRRRAA
jgi:hypothetical protein